jgi:predicted nuclease with TOPRIM domain
VRGQPFADRPGISDPRYLDSELTDFDIIAREINGYRTRFEAIEKRLNEVEKVNARLEEAALTTARAMSEISAHWDAVYEAMRRRDESQTAR